jgi:NAD(P)-dependent dehydrogenase (short-subunit alcohol dehydrogenase family)
MATYLITGANRGIGLEFVRQLIARGDAVIGTARDLAALSAEARAVPGVRWVALEVADPASIDSLPSRLDALGSIDVLINNAGVSSTAKTLAELTGIELHRVFAVNTFAPLLVTKALMPLLTAGGRKLIVNITSQLGSITNNTGGSTYAYRASKTGLNQLNASLANELRPAGFTCLAMHPGWVQTDMGGKQATLTPETSVRHLLGVIDKAEPAMSGRFFNYDGTPLPW